MHLSSIYITKHSMSNRLAGYLDWERGAISGEYFLNMTIDYTHAMLHCQKEGKTLKIYVIDPGKGSLSSIRLKGEEKKRSRFHYTHHPKTS